MQSDSERAEHPTAPGDMLAIRSKIWIERGDNVVLSEWRVGLLEAIETHGSLSRAAESLDVPYRTAWERVKSMEAELGVRLLESESGGASGGGSRLTPEARDLCSRFRHVSNGIQEVVSRRFAAEFASVQKLVARGEDH
jgi:molybdate transport system regulatory protein